MAGTVEDVIRIAESQLGETDGAKYFEYFGCPDYGAWCVAGARWCYANADVDCHWNNSFQAFDWRDVPRDYAVEPGNLQRGDFVSFDWPEDGNYDGKGDHVGIVTGVYDWGISTIEFNTDWGRVARKQRVWAVVICGIRPTYARSKAQWIKKDGRWWYRHADGSYTRNGWEQIDGKWYWFDKDGWMLESTCVHDSTGWYALGASGAMLTDVKTHNAHDGRFGALEL